jgi:hypothetical protein
MYLLQNLFYKSKHKRTMSLNADYVVLLKNPRDASQVNAVSRQMYLGKSKFLVEAFRYATQRAYEYLLIT